MAMHYINHLGKRGADFLHSGGKQSTDYLLDEVIKLNPSSVMEIGCGTGATLVSLASKSNKVFLVGIDSSASQIEMAKKRIRHCELETLIQLNVGDLCGKLRFEDHSFDVVFAESVLGILDQKDLLNAIREVKRILKPGGIFISNDAIWKATVSKEIVELVNKRAMHDFGLIQSASELIGKRAWQEYFKLAGLTCNKAIDIHELKRNQVIAQNSIEKKSHDFTRKEKFFSVLNPFQQIREMNYRARLKLFHQHDGSYLEHYIFVWQS
jgi:ubiquinone/menaquinone biosynthesis C-methylase UbiE